MYSVSVTIAPPINLDIEVGVSSPATGGATVQNSTLSYQKTLLPGEVFTLPNIVHTDSNGNPVVTPAQVPFVATACTPATVRNSDVSYTNTVAAAGLLVLPDITIYESDGVTASTTIPSVKDYTLQGVTVTDGGGTVTLEDGDTYTAKTVLKLYWGSGDSDVIFTVDAESATTYTAATDDGGSGTITYSIDTGGGYLTATLPFTVAIGDLLKAVRTSTGSIGFVRLTD